MDCLTGGEAAARAHDPGVVPHPDDQLIAAAGDARLDLDAEYWRREVATRLQRYRARRKPRPPRYPSLRLPFESSENWPTARAAAIPSSSSLAPEIVAPVEEAEPGPRAVPFEPAVADEREYAAKVIEFPRWAAVPIAPANELADPVFDRPRIVEAPEVLPPPPAMGGILIDAQTNRESERAIADDCLPAAPLARRMLAGLLDGLVLGVALAAFGAMFAWVNPALPPWPVLAVSVAAVATVMWAAYQFLFVVYTGSTPGSRLARLQLTRFDGMPVNRRIRRWRVLASYLSALSLGLGYIWSFLDEDGLAWHDRMTRTHFS